MATNDTTPAPAGDGATAAAATETPAKPRRRIPGRALAITGIAVGSVLTLGLTFAGGVALGQVLPGGPGDRGPLSSEAGAQPGGPAGDRGERIEQRLEERMEQRDERRDERRAQFEQWLQEQGIDPSEIPAPPTP